MTANTEAPVAKRPRRTTAKVTAKVEAPAKEETPAAERAPRRTRKAAAQPVTVRKVALGVDDLPKALYDDALERVGGDPRKLYRVRVLSRNAYEMDLPRPKSD